MADVKKINGYNVKDETARNGLLAKQDIMQFSTMPADTDWGKIVQYIGATGANYTEGYFYKAIAGLSNTVAPTGVTATVTDGDKFTAFMKYIENLVGVVNFDGIDHITITIQLSNNILYGYIQYYDANGRRAGIVSNYPLSDYEQNTGMTITGASENDLITADVVKVASWQQTNVQPGGSGGSYSAGTGINIANNTISIDSIVLRNTSTAQNGVATAGSGGAANNAFAAGVNSYAASGAVGVGYNAIANAANNVQLGAGTNSLQGTLKVFNVQYTYHNDITGQVTFNPYLIGIGDRTPGSVLMYLDDQKATWVKPERNVPEMSNVQAIQRLHPEQYVDNDFKAHNTELEFRVNMKPADVVKAANDLYVTVSRWKRNRRISVLYQGEDVNIRTRGKYSVMNDQRVKLDHKMYCWRYLDDESLDNENPNKWRFFYTESNYNSVAALVSDDPNVWLSCDSNLVSNYATCLNALTSAGGYAVSDMGNSQYIFRYADGDIDTYAHNGVSGLSSYLLQTVYHCKEFYDKTNDRRLFSWSEDWTNGSGDVYVMTSSGVTLWNQVAQHFDELTAQYTVDEVIAVYDEEIDRKDLDFKMFNTNQGSIGDFCDYLYDTTVLGNIGDTNINWIAYWFDYPIMPTLLSECYVMIPKNITGGVYRAGTRVKLKTLMKEGVVENYFDTTEDMKFILPWDTYYLWMRFLSWQKLCFYDITFQLGSWSLKNSLTYAVSWSSGTDTVY